MFWEILDSCNYVVNNSKDVKINYEKIAEFTKSTNFSEDHYWLKSSPFEILELDTKDIINFLLIYHSIGFSYWGNPKWTVQTNKGTLDGSYAMMYSLLEEMRKNEGFLNSDNLQSMTKEELQRILKGSIEIPLFNERYFNIINVAKTINSRMNGDFYEYVKGIQNDKELFEIIIGNFDGFKDIRNYEGHEIYFYKLAQLLVSDILHVYEIKDNKSVDYSHLVGCADYKVPQVMRNLGILEYSEELANLIDNMRELEENSRYEVEIRASMIVVINEIKKRVSCNICAMDVSDYIWLIGQDKSKQLNPYHLTRTTSY